MSSVTEGKHDPDYWVRNQRALQPPASSATTTHRPASSSTSIPPEHKSAPRATLSSSSSFATTSATVSSRTTPLTPLQAAQIAKIAKTFSVSATRPTTQDCFEAVYAACKAKKWTLLDKNEKLLHRLVSSEGRPLVHEALWRGEYEIANGLIERNISLHVQDAEGNSPIHYVGRRGDLTLLEKIFEHNTLNEQNSLGQTPAHFAAQTNNYRILSHLTKNGATVDTPATFHRGNHTLEQVTPFHVATICGHQKALDILIARRPNLGLQVPGIGNIVHIAIFFGHTLLLKKLLTKYKQQVAPLLEAPNSDGLTPLMFAARNGDGEALLALKEAGAPLEARDATRRTALHWAVDGRQRVTINLLAYFGCKLSTPDIRGKSPRGLLDGAEDPPSISLAKYLLNLETQSELLDELPPLYTLRPPENLIFKGGGPKGIAYVGALQSLEHQDMMGDVRRCAGTSAGAITSTLVACGYSAQEVGELLATTSLGSFLDHPLSNVSLQSALSNVTIRNTYTIFKELGLAIHSPLSSLKKVLKKLWSTTGLCKGEVFREKMEEWIFAKTKIRHCTFAELGELSRENPSLKQLYVYATNLRTRKPTCLSAENPQFAHVIISDGVRASMSIPGAFQPHTLHMKKEGARVIAPELGTWADGGMLVNYPIDAFDKRKYLSAYSGQAGEFFTINKQSLGFSLYTPGEVVPNAEIATIGDLLKAIVSLYSTAEEIFREQVYDNQYRTIEISNEGVGLLDFNLAPERQQQLIQAGQRATNQFLERQRETTTTKHSRLIRSKILQQASGSNLIEPHPTYIARPALQAYLEKHLLDKDRLATLLLYGAPGVGKTELSIAFADQHFSHFSFAWSIQAETPEKLHESYRTLARHLGVYFDPKDSSEVVISSVHRHLEQLSGKPYLLIFDNAEAPPKLPRGKGAVLITSNKKFHDNALEVGPFTQAEGTALIRKILEREPGDAGLALIQALKCYPIAISQALYFIKQSEGMITLEQYLPLITRQEQTLGQTASPGSRYVRAIDTTWRLIFEKLSTHHPKALEWLTLCALLSPDGIPAEWITTYLQRPGLDEISCLLEKREMIKTLADYGLIRYAQATDQLFIHRFEQRKIQALLPQEKLEEAQKKLLAVLETYTDKIKPHKPEDWPAFTLLRPHLLHLMETLTSLPPPLQKMLVEFSVFERRLGDAQKGREILEKVLPSIKASRDQDLHAAALSNLGSAWNDLGQPQKAIEQYEESLKMYQELYPSQSHPNISTSLNNLGNAWLDLGQPQKAIDLHEQSLKMRRQLHPSQSHPSIATSLNNLGNAWLDLGQPQKAIDLHEQSLKMRRELYPSHSHPDIADSLNNLGLAWDDLGQPQKAIELYEESLKMYRELYPSQSHPSIADSLHNLGGAWQALGQPQKAIELYEESLKMYRELYPSQSHPSIADSLHNLGGAWQALGQPQKAIELYEESLKMYRELYPSQSHSDIADSLHNLGLAWNNLRQPQKAIELYEESLKMYRKLYPSQPHPSIADSLSHLGIAWRALGQPQKAIELYEESLKMRRELYPSQSHPSIANSLSDLGVAWDDLGQPQKAIELYEESLKMKRELYPSQSHPSIATTLNNLGLLWHDLGQPQKAIDLFEQCLKMERELYPSQSHPSIADSLNSLGIAWQWQGNRDKSLAYYLEAFEMRKEIFGLEHPKTQSAKKNVDDLQAQTESQTSEQAVSLRAKKKCIIA